MEGVESIECFKVDPASGFFKHYKADVPKETDLSSHQSLRDALTRRDLCFDNCRLVDFHVFQEWTEILLEALRAPPADVDCAQVSLNQIYRADMALFKALMSATREGIRPNADGSFPLELGLLRTMDLPQVRLHLNHKEKVGGARQAPQQKTSTEQEEKIKRL